MVLSPTESRPLILGVLAIGRRRTLRTPQALISTILALTLLAIAAPLANAQLNYTVLHTFTGSPDGVYPSPLIRDSKGNLYGAKKFDGANNTGCLFRIDTKGNYSDLLDFAANDHGSADGLFPNGLVLGSTGDFYGSMTLGGGGFPGFGTLFHITP